MKGVNGLQRSPIWLENTLVSGARNLSYGIN